MNRRTLGLGLVATIAGIRHTIPARGLARSVDAPSDWCGRQFLSSSDGDDFHTLRAIVSEHESETDARGMVQHLTWYFQQPEADDGSFRQDVVVEEMAQPAGYRLTWTVISSEGAVEAYHEAAQFRRGHYSWNVMGIRDIASVAITIIPELVQTLATRDVGRGTPEPGSGRGGLWNLVPDEEDLGGDYRLESWFDPSGTYTADGEPIDE